MIYRVVIQLLNAVIYLAGREAQLKSKLSAKLYAYAAKAEVQAREAFDDANGAATLANNIEKLLK